MKKVGACKRKKIEKIMIFLYDTQLKSGIKRDKEKKIDVQKRKNDEMNEWLPLKIHS